jgi:hypothetical protein
VFPVAVVTAVGWLVLFVGLLAVPPSARSRGGGLGHPGYGRAPESPAVVSLLAGRLGRDGFGATLLDLADRGWFRLVWPEAPARGRPPAGPVMCLVPAEAPAEELTPYERRVVAHVAARAGARGVVPAPVLSDGFEDGRAEFMRTFGDAVAADARERGLTRPRLSPRRIALLCALLLIPACALVLDVRRPGALACAGASYVVLSWLTIVVGVRRRCSAAGQAVLDRWRATAASGGGRRLLAYAAAVGAAPAAVAVFAPPPGNVAWSDYRGGWRQIAIETNTWPWWSGLAVVAAVVGGPLLYVGVLIWLNSLGLSVLADDLTGLTFWFGLAGIVVWTLRAWLFPRFAEFDGQVIRQWVLKGGDDGPDQYHLAIDDGVRAKAWDLVVEGSLYGQAAPGALVHARVSGWRGAKVSAWLVKPAAVARRLADPGVPWDPRGRADPAETTETAGEGSGSGDPERGTTIRSA